MFFKKDLVNIFLKISLQIEKFEKHYLIFIMAVLSYKNRLLYFAFIHLYLIISANKN